jgi:hypothetical protein
LARFYSKVARRHGGKAIIALARKFLGVIDHTFKNNGCSPTSPTSCSPKHRNEAERANARKCIA